MSIEVEQFLRNIGLDSDVVKRFADNKIKYRCLPLLTNEHIKILLPCIGDEVLFKEAVEKNWNIQKSKSCKVKIDSIGPQAKLNFDDTKIDIVKNPFVDRYETESKVDPSIPEKKKQCKISLNLSKMIKDCLKKKIDPPLKKLKRKKSQLTSTQRKTMIRSVFLTNKVQTEKVVTSVIKDLKECTPLLFEQCPKDKRKLIDIEKACVICPYCFQELTPVVVVSEKKGRIRLQISNFRRHLIQMHKAQGKTKLQRPSEESHSSSSDSSSSSSDSENGSSSKGVHQPEQNDVDKLMPESTAVTGPADESKMIDELAVAGLIVESHPEDGTNEQVVREAKEVSEEESPRSSPSNKYMDYAAGVSSELSDSNSARENESASSVRNKRGLRSVLKRKRISTSQSEKLHKRPKSTRRVKSTEREKWTETGKSRKLNEREPKAKRGDYS